jgi:hypothetical protein
MQEVPDYLRIARRVARRTNTAESVEPRPSSEEEPGIPEREESEVSEQSPTADQEREVRRLVRAGVAENAARFEVSEPPDNGHHGNCLCDECFPPARSEENEREEGR